MYTSLDLVDVVFPTTASTISTAGSLPVLHVGAFCVGVGEALVVGLYSEHTVTFAESFLVTLLYEFVGTECLDSPFDCTAMSVSVAPEMGVGRAYRKDS